MKENTVILSLEKYDNFKKSEIDFKKLRNGKESFRFEPLWFSGEEWIIYFYTKDKILNVLADKISSLEKENKELISKNKELVAKKKWYKIR